MRRLIALTIVLTTALLNSAVAQDTALEGNSVVPPEAAVSQQSNAASRQTVIVVRGAIGAAEFEAPFHEWIGRIQDVCQRAGVESTFIGLGTDTSATDLSAFTDAVTEASSVKTLEPLWIVYFGHGSFDGREAALNFRGPDLDTAAFASVLSSQARPVAVVLCASCTAPFINALSAPNRVIVTATKDGNQIQYSRFGDAFTKALSGTESDIDRDGQTSLLEAWLFASRRTGEFYSTEGRLASEHSLLDDNGDAKGTRAEVYDGFRLKDNISNSDQLDGRLASNWCLIRTIDEQRLSAEQRQQRQDLESQLEVLRKQRDSLTEAEYLDKLEALLLPLAELYKVAPSDEPSASTAPPSQE